MSLPRRALLPATLGCLVCIVGVTAGAYAWSSEAEDRIGIGDGRTLGVGRALDSSRPLHAPGERGDDAQNPQTGSQQQGGQADNPVRGATNDVRPHEDETPPLQETPPQQGVTNLGAPAQSDLQPSPEAEEKVVTAPSDHLESAGEAVDGAAEGGPQGAPGAAAESEPDPAPAPAAPPATGAEPLFAGDSLSKFVTQAKAGRVTTVRPGDYRFETRPGDYLSDAEKSYGAARSEVYIDTQRWPGIAAKDQLLFYSGSFMFEPGYDMANPDAWRTIIQFKHNDESGAPFDFYAQGSAGLRYGSVDGPKIADIEVGKPYPWLLEAVWSEDPAEALQRVYLFGEQVAEGHETVKGGESIYPKFGLYMSETVQPSAIRHWDFLVGTSRSAVGR